MGGRNFVPDDAFADRLGADRSLASDGLEKVGIVQQTQAPFGPYFDYMTRQIGIETTLTNLARRRERAQSVDASGKF